MNTLIGFNIICFVISTIIILVMFDGTTKEKIIGICLEPIFMGLLSFGAWLMTNGK